jgi:hypothetical protein
VGNLAKPKLRLREGGAGFKGKEIKRDMLKRMG